MRLLLICLLYIGHSFRIKTDSSLPRRPYAQFASRAERRFATKGIAWRSGLFATHALPGLATQSRLSHALDAPRLFVPSDDESNQRSETQSQASMQWPSKPWWPEEFEKGQTVRYLDTNEEFVIEGFFSASGQKVMRCRSMRDDRIAWLQPEQVSHELAQPYISPHDGEDTNGRYLEKDNVSAVPGINEERLGGNPYKSRWDGADADGRPFERNDDVIIRAVRGIRETLRGQITMFRPATSRGIEDGLDLTVRVDYVLNGVICHVWCDPFELQWIAPESPPGPF